MARFQDLGLSPDALRAVEKLGYDEPTPVQEQAIPKVLAGGDLIAAASTGTGKTAAFLLPSLSRLQPSKAAGRAPRMLVITPTRELAQQIARNAIAVARCTGHYVTAVYGGAKYAKQTAELRRGTDVLVATPGRLCDLMDRRAADLSRIEVLVLDEADRMLDMGFLPDVSRIVGQVPPARQTLLFSATIDDKIRRKLGDMLRDPETIQIAKKGETARSVDHYLLPVKQKDKPSLLMAVLDEMPAERIIIFARTKARVEEVARMLEDAGVPAESIHSDRSQAERRQALQRFRKADPGIIVATDVLARGIDVPAVDYVVNYDLPDMPEDYIHRIGRTGRAGRAGLALSFASQNSMKALQSIERLIGRPIPVRSMRTFDLDLQLLQSRREKRKLSHSDKRAANFDAVRSKRRKARIAGSADYDYTGWGDKRAGGRKQKPREGAPERGKGRRGAARQAKPAGKRAPSKRAGRPAGKKRATGRKGAGRKGRR